MPLDWSYVRRLGRGRIFCNHHQGWKRSPPLWAVRIRATIANWRFRMADQSIKELQNEILRLKIRLEKLEQYLATTRELPILGPTRQQAYRDDVDKAMERLHL